MGNFMNLFKTVFLFSADPQDPNGNPSPTPPPVVTPPPTPDPKLYNQDQLNGIVGSRIAEERKKIYSQLGVNDDQELKAFLDNAKIIEQENATLKSQIAEHEAKQIKEAKEKKLLEAGIEADLIDVALAKWDGKDETLEAFIEGNPKLTTAYFEGKFFMGTGPSLEQKGGKVKSLNEMSVEEFMEYHRNKEQK